MSAGNNMFKWTTAMTATIAGKRAKDVFGLAVALAIPLVAGLAGSILTSQSVSEWYPALTKPSFTPPNWVFGPIWTALYARFSSSEKVVFMKVLDIVSVMSEWGKDFLSNRFTTELWPVLREKVSLCLVKEEAH